MYKDASLPPLALIAGPTASGKSALALAIAERTGGTIINADSAQVYRDLRVLSARPSEADEARVPHRLFGHVDGGRAYNAADWAAAARAEVAAVHARGGLPILVGGSGLYLRTLLDGIAPVPEIDADVRAAVRALPVDEAYRALMAEDPGRAARLRPRDTARIARALEVIHATGRSLDAWQEERAGGIGWQVDLRPLLLLPDRAWLYARCDARFAAMMEDGAVHEVQALIARALPADLPVMRAIGVREIAGALTGALSWEAARAAGGQATRRYAKRQYTWLAHQAPPEWHRLSSTVRSLDDILLLFDGLTA